MKTQGQNIKIRRSDVKHSSVNINRKSASYTDWVVCQCCHCMKQKVLWLGIHAPRIMASYSSHDFSSRRIYNPLINFARAHWRKHFTWYKIGRRLWGNTRRPIWYPSSVFIHERKQERKSLFQVLTFQIQSQGNKIEKTNQLGFV